MVRVHVTSRPAKPTKVATWHLCRCFMDPLGRKDPLFCCKQFPQIQAQKARRWTLVNVQTASTSPVPNVSATSETPCTPSRAATWNLGGGFTIKKTLRLKKRRVFWHSHWSTFAVKRNLKYGIPACLPITSQTYGVVQQKKKIGSSPWTILFWWHRMFQYVSYVACSYFIYPLVI